MRPINILCSYASMLDATSLYRGAGPITDLCRRYGYTQEHPAEVTWATMARADLLFLQRPHSDAHLSMADMARRCSVPVWCDWDDDLFHVPPENQSYGYYCCMPTRERLKRMAGIADVVTCSTEGVANVFKPYAKDVRVIPNAWDTRMFPYAPPRPRRKKLWWRGSIGHIGNLQAHKEGFAKVAEALGDHELVFCSEMRWVLTWLMPRPSLRDPMDVVFYFQMLRDEGPSVCIQPMTDTPFNRARSHIAWLEATWAGAVTVAPDLPEFHGKPGAATYAKPEDFAEVVVRTALLTNDERKKMNEAAAAEVQANYRLGKVNDRRREIVEKLCGGKASKAPAAQEAETVPA